MDNNAKRNNTVLVFGAYGHTGRFIVDALLRRGLVPVLAGRDPRALASLGAKHPGLEVRVATVDDDAEAAEVVRGVGVVINAAGPFLATARPLAAAAAQAGAHYLDVSAEQGSVRDLYAAFGPGGATIDTAVIPAMSFYGGLADLLATAAADDWLRVDSVEIGIGLDRWWPTRGTRITGARNTATRLRVEDARLVPVPPVAQRRIWTFPDPIGTQTVLEQPFSEMITMSKHLHAARMRNFLSEIALTDIHDASTEPPRAVDAHGRSAQRFVVEAIVARGDQVRRSRASGQDIYHVTAPLVAEAAERLIDGRFSGAGALAPAEAFEADDFLVALGREWLHYAPVTSRAG